MLRVTAVEPLEGHRLRITFNDGGVREVDCSFLLRGTLGEPLRELDYFRQVRVDEEARTVVWPNGLDPAPELLHSDYEPPACQPRRRGHPSLKPSPESWAGPDASGHATSRGSSTRWWSAHRSGRRP